ncbi:MAG: glycosyltransferase [Alphaproteobacteria bacterium]|nr:glycosyltransferase [Alphaproteobacteria bacterium]
MTQLGTGYAIWSQLGDVLITVAWVAFVLSLIVVCALGTHLLVITGTFLANRKKGMAIEAQLAGIPLPAELPRVLIQLPTFNEGGVVERALESAAAIDWPRDRLRIQLLDDSNDGTDVIGQAKIQELRARGVDAQLIHRTNREGYKAGALKNGLLHDDSEYVAIFDADFIPPKDILRRTIGPLAADQRLAYVQTRWEHINQDENLLTRAQSLMLDAHFAVEQAARNWSGLFMPFNGTGGIWRRAAIDDAGGWEGDTLTEDIDLAIRASLRGWQTAFMPSVAIPGELPENVPAWRQQQFRWTKGFTQVAMKLLPSVYRSPRLTFIQKFAMTFQLFQGWAYPAGAVALFSALSAMVLTSTQPWGIFFLGVFSTVFGGFTVFAMTATGQWALKRKPTVKTFIAFLSMLALNGGLTLSNTRSIWEALRGTPSAFVRTPKGRDAELDKARPTKGHSGMGELILAVGAVAVAIWDEAWYSPFFALTVFGLALVGAASLTAQLNRQA